MSNSTLVNTSTPLAPIQSNGSNAKSATICPNCCGTACPSFPDHEFIATGIRTAVIISGQLRTANITFASGKMLRTREFFWFGSTDAPTPAGTVIENLFKILWSQGPFDVFMHLQADPLLNETWNGDPATYREQLRDTRGCEVYSSHPIFHGTGNSFFCIVEPEQQLMNTFIGDYSIWNQYYYIVHGNDRKKREQILQQWYALYKGNLGCKQFSLSKNIEYTHKVRLRPDTGVLMPFPLYSEMNFGPRIEKACNSTIYYHNTPMIKSMGGQDVFNVGLTKDMDRLFSTYLDFISTKAPADIQHSGLWLAEQYQETNLKQTWNICMEYHEMIKMVPLRADADWRRPRVEWNKQWEDWKEMSS